MTSVSPSNGKCFNCGAPDNGRQPGDPCEWCGIRPSAWGVSGPAPAPPPLPVEFATAEERAEWLDRVKYSNGPLQRRVLAVPIAPAGDKVRQ